MAVRSANTTWPFLQGSMILHQFIRRTSTFCIVDISRMIEVIGSAGFCILWFTAINLSYERLKRCLFQSHAFTRSSCISMIFSGEVAVLCADRFLRCPSLWEKLNRPMFQGRAIQTLRDPYSAFRWGWTQVRVRYCSHQSIQLPAQDRLSPHRSPIWSIVNDFQAREQCLYEILDFRAFSQWFRKPLSPSPETLVVRQAMCSRPVQYCWNIPPQICWIHFWRPSCSCL